MRKKIQSFFLSAGNFACYAFCIIRLAEKITGMDIDVMSALQAGIDKGFIRFDEDCLSSPNNFYVFEPAKFLEYLSGWKCNVKKEAADYGLREGELCVYCWKRLNSMHFRLADWDPLENSQTVKYGVLDSLRVFYPV
ncbi:DUF261 family protein [Treponema sp.]|uniref:DUF261 family protein n=1 Tax=Treponema sp. TaxID=166 RepID=UPI003FA2591C